MLEVWTNGTVSPEDSLSLASMLLKDHLTIFIHLEESMREGSLAEPPEEISDLDALLGRAATGRRPWSRRPCAPSRWCC